MINEAKKELIKDVRWALIHKPVEGMKVFSQVTSYNCDNYGLSSLNGINKFSNLETLSAYNNVILSLKELENMTTLKNLILNSNKFFETEGLTFLKNLTNLQELHLSNNNLTSLEGLENLHNLKYLNVQANKITDITPILGLSNIERLYINGNQLESMAGFGSFPKLIALACQNNLFPNPFPNKNSAEVANIVRDNPLYSSMKISKFMKIGMFDHLNSFEDFESKIFEKVESLKEWKDRLFKKYPKGEILKDSEYHYFFKSENDATKCCDENSKLNSSKSKKVCIEKFKK